MDKEKTVEQEQRDNCVSGGACLVETDVDSDKKKENDKKIEGEDMKKDQGELKSHFQRFKIIQTIEMGDLVLNEYDSICSDGAVVICGFPSENLCSTTVANYVIEQLNLPLVGTVGSNLFPPFCVVRNGLPSGGLRVYGNKRVVVFTSEFDLKDYTMQNSVIDLIYNFCVRHRASMLIVVDGIVSDPTKKRTSSQLHRVTFEKKLSKLSKAESGEVGEEEEDGVEDAVEDAESNEDSNVFETDEEEALIESKEDILKLLQSSLEEGSKEQMKKIYFSTNSEKIGSKLLSMSHSPVVEFADLSMTSGILARASTSSVDVVCLLAPLNKYLQIGVRSSITLISCIDRLLSKEQLFDLSELGKSAESLEKEIKNEISKLLVVDKDTSKAYNNMYM